MVGNFNIRIKESIAQILVDVVSSGRKERPTDDEGLFDLWMRETCPQWAGFLHV